MTEPEHDAMALVVDTVSIPRKYQAVCRCGWRGQVTLYGRARGEAEWHNERDGRPVT